MSDCIFCEIANGNIPSTTLWEDEDFRVILDLGPAFKGHCLVLPKAHYANVFEMPEELTGKAFATAKHVAERMKKAMGAAGVNIVQNNGEAAGQTVHHFHIHVIPRYENGPKAVAWEPGTLTDEDKKDILDRWNAVSCDILQ